MKYDFEAFAECTKACMAWIESSRKSNVIFHSTGFKILTAKPFQYVIASDQLAMDEKQIWEAVVARAQHIASKLVIKQYDSKSKGNARNVPASKRQMVMGACC